MLFIPFIRLSVGTTPAANSGKILYNYSIAMLDEVMKRNDAFVEEDDSDRFTSIYTKTFLQSAKSIYTAKRHANTLAEALPLLKDKVNICDLVTITGIKIFYPKLYELIKANGNALAGGLLLNDSYEQEIEEIRTMLDAIIDVHHEEGNNGSSIREMLVLLFPRLGITDKGILQADDRSVEKRRICSAAHFDLYFSVKYATL